MKCIRFLLGLLHHASRVAQQDLCHGTESDGDVTQQVSIRTCLINVAGCTPNERGPSS